MSTFNEDLLDDIKLARDKITSSDFSMVIIKSKILKQIRGRSVIQLFILIEKMSGLIDNATLGMKFLDKPTALLCRYANIKAVYAQEATKTGIAVLIMSGIVNQVDKLIKNSQDSSDYFDKLFKNVDTPEEVYQILKEEIHIDISTYKQAVIDPLTGRDITGEFIFDHKRNLQEELQIIFSKAEKYKTENMDLNSIYYKLSNEIKNIIQGYYDALKLPVDENFVKQNIEKLAMILGVK